MRKIGPHSRPDKLAIIDGRRAEARLMKRVREELVAHCGGHPSATQQMIIQQAAALSLRIHLMDRDTARKGTPTEKNAREYLCWANALSRLLRQLGWRGAAIPAPSLSDLDWGALRGTPAAA